MEKCCNIPCERPLVITNNIMVKTKVTEVKTTMCNTSGDTRGYGPVAENMASRSKDQPSLLGAIP